MSLTGYDVCTVGAACMYVCMYCIICVVDVCMRCVWRYALLHTRYLPTLAGFVPVAPPWSATALPN